MPLISLISEGIMLLLRQKSYDALESFKAALECSAKNDCNIWQNHLVASEDEYFSCEHQRAIQPQHYQIAANEPAAPRIPMGDIPGDLNIHSISLLDEEGLAANIFDESKTLSHENNRFRLYNRAFLITVSSPRGPNRQLLLSLCHLEISAVVFYNMGLVHHHIGLVKRECDGSVKHLIQALEFYNMAITMLFPAILHNCSHLDLGLLEMALYNNIGHIHAHFYNSFEVEKCSELMGKRLQSITPNADAHDDDFLFFSSAVARCHMYPTNCAPAA